MSRFKRADPPRFQRRRYLLIQAAAMSSESGGDDIFGFNVGDIFGSSVSICLDSSVSIVPIHACRLSRFKRRRYPHFSGSAGMPWAATARCGDGERRTRRARPARRRARRLRQ
jgi:hypothetical protein